jgi:hypothetical protein
MVLREVMSRCVRNKEVALIVVIGVAVQQLSNSVPGRTAGGGTCLPTRSAAFDGQGRLEWKQRPSQEGCAGILQGRPSAKAKRQESGRFEVVRG